MEKKDLYVERTKDNYRAGYNCCQAIVLAFCDRYNLDEETALKISCSFGGGMGRMKEVCGAVCAMAIVAGLETGNVDPKNKDAKQMNYEMTRYLTQKFQRENGSIYCSELTSLEGIDVATKIQEKDGYYKKKPCIEYVADCARILSKQFVSPDRNDY